ncbi:helix-turn-helix transcriptional regulator [Maridesulfovibrio sp.]|uniref:helix-turn-helix transcriptional regulator n=1 Tax=Maridesulfovibrio sp. TaxID=2795000 RepID=UPI0029F4A7F8|nr:helix-turn-helix transcriptional regulator [Maridesulfovibrio sp.]
MPITFTIDSDQSKRLAFDLWCRENGVKKKDLAELMDVSPQRFSQILNGEYVSSAVYDELKELEIEGLKIPSELIPVPSSPKKPGPKAKEA